MVDGVSFISSALQGNAGHEGRGGFVDMVVIPACCASVVADAPGWAGGGWWCLSLVVFCLWLHWPPLPSPSACGGTVTGTVKRRVRGGGRADG